MIVVVQHTSELHPRNCFDSPLTVKGCAWAPGDSEANIRDDITALKNSPYVRNEIPVIGYVLDVDTGELKEVRYVYPPSYCSPPCLFLLELGYKLGRSLREDGLRRLTWNTNTPLDKFSRVRFVPTV
jgi:hypothetical protein